ncbi:hypothetical protein LIA77_04959 [Sarocladium implicatum]|nr:hypothetical protein LIA77_04959 [Sarocladium implicatum]
MTRVAHAIREIAGRCAWQVPACGFVAGAAGPAGDGIGPNNRTEQLVPSRLEVSHCLLSLAWPTLLASTDCPINWLLTTRAFFRMKSLPPLFDPPDPDPRHPNLQSMQESSPSQARLDVYWLLCINRVVSVAVLRVGPAGGLEVAVKCGFERGCIPGNIDKAPSDERATIELVAGGLVSSAVHYAHHAPVQAGYGNQGRGPSVEANALAVGCRHMHIIGAQFRTPPARPDSGYESLCLFDDAHCFLVSSLSHSSE